MTTILHKRGTGRPSADDLSVGEIALDTSAGTAYTKLSNGTVVEIGGSGGDSAGAGMVISKTEPVDKVDGMQWLEADTGLVFIWDENKWLQFPAGSESGGSSGGYGSIGSVKAKAVGNISAGDFVQIPDRYAGGDADDVYLEAVNGDFRASAFGGQVSDGSATTQSPGYGEFKSASVDSSKSILFAKRVRQPDNSYRLDIQVGKLSAANEGSPSSNPDGITFSSGLSAPETVVFGSRSIDVINIPDTNLCVAVWRESQLKINSRIYEVGQDGTISVYDNQSNIIPDGVERSGIDLCWNPVTKKILLTAKSKAPTIDGVLATVDIDNKKVTWGSPYSIVQDMLGGVTEGMGNARSMCFDPNSGYFFGAFASSSSQFISCYAVESGGSVPAAGQPVVVNTGGVSLESGNTSLSVAYSEKDNCVGLFAITNDNSVFAARIKTGSGVDDLTQEPFSSPKVGNFGLRVRHIEAVYDPFASGFSICVGLGTEKVYIMAVSVSGDDISASTDSTFWQANSHGGFLFSDFSQRAVFQYTDASNNSGAVVYNTPADTANYNGSFVGSAVTNATDGDEVTVASAGSIITVTPEKIDDIQGKLLAGSDYVLTRGGLAKRYVPTVESQTTGPRIGYALSNDKMLLGGYRQMKQVTRSGKALPVLKKIKQALKINDLEFRDLLDGLGIEGEEE